MNLIHQITNFELLFNVQQSSQYILARTNLYFKNHETYHCHYSFTVLHIDSLSTQFHCCIFSNLTKHCTIIQFTIYHPTQCYHYQQFQLRPLRQLYFCLLPLGSHRMLTINQQRQRSQCCLPVKHLIELGYFFATEQRTCYYQFQLSLQYIYCSICRFVRLNFFLLCRRDSSNIYSTNSAPITIINAAMTCSVSSSAIRIGATTNYTLIYTPSVFIFADSILQVLYPPRSSYTLTNFQSFTSSAVCASQCSLRTPNLAQSLNNELVTETNLYSALNLQPSLKNINAISKYFSISLQLYSDPQHLNKTERNLFSIKLHYGSKNTPDVPVRFTEICRKGVGQVLDYEHIQQLREKIHSKFNQVDFQADNADLIDQTEFIFVLLQILTTLLQIV